MTIDHLDTPHKRQVALWALRMLSSNLALPHFINDHHYTDADIAECLRLTSNAENITPHTSQEVLIAMRDEIKNHPAVALDDHIISNLQHFATILHLSDIEHAIVTFLVVQETSNLLTDTMRVLKSVYEERPHRLIALALDLPHDEVELTLRKNSRLWASGIIQFDQSRVQRRKMIAFFSSDMAKVLCDGHCDAKRIVSTLGVVRATPSSLSQNDYPHLEPQLTDLITYLRATIRAKHRGVNILLHGAPGTGKTQLTRVIAELLATPLYDYATHDQNGDPKSAIDRLCSMRVAGPYFEQIQALFVFDEFEDLITATQNERGAANRCKGWFNQLLENNPHPVFWLTNSLHDLDPAYARRFHFILEVSIPPRSQRAKILSHHVGHHLSDSTIHRLSTMENLAPAVVSQVSHVMEVISDELSPDRRDEAMVRMVSSFLEAQGHSTEALSHEEILPHGVYDPACLNADADLPQLAALLRQHPQARLCLHGPPGTGKTAFSHWLAKEIDRPLHLRRASDLLSPLVGVAEKNIARAFASAQRDDAILLIDEVDSFLQDRSKALRSWEITQVNELLTRMEIYPGIFIATTNRLEQLDPASLRRFDLKLHFGYLAPAQIHDLLHAWCFRLGIGTPDDECDHMIQAMHCVTPGDFAANARRHRFQPFRHATDFLAAINTDVALKPEQRRNIGFY